MNPETIIVHSQAINVVAVTQESAPTIHIDHVGIQGPRGFSILSGEGDPSPMLGVNDDLYLDVNTTYLYKKISGDWEYQTNLGTVTETFEITSLEIAQKYIILDRPPRPNNTRVSFVSGIEQPRNSYTISENILSWDGLGLEPFIEEGDILIVTY